MPDKSRWAGLRPHRRAFLSLIGAGAVAAPAILRPARAAEDPILQGLIEQNQRKDLGQDFDSASRTIHMPKSSLPTLSPSTADTTAQAVGEYEGILSRGGWPRVPPVDRLRLGNRHRAVVALRKRLAVTGDLDAHAGLTDIYDSYVEAAVRRFQARHGISIDGIVRPETISRMNVPCDVRVGQLKTNVGRLKALSKDLGERYVMVNIPAAQVEAVENGVAVGRYTAVVGRPDRPSPDVNSKITAVNFNPYWTVPVSLVRRDLEPLMQKDPTYLTTEHIHIYDMHGQELQPSQIDWNSNEAVNYRFRQDPGDFNSLGTMRIQFPSPDGVYMHDTPEKGLFGSDMRFHSSGCVRVQNVRELVEWLLRDTPGWSHQQIEETVKSGARIDAKLAKPVPVHWVYITAWATPDGVVQFRDDIYNKDGLGMYATTAKG
ncbi:MAG TPA: L,D-transpeptidase family protein [Pseudolabrys sp.]|uniref:L,D-transpeptidase family protein n=1 Tax=Pseudolabrys sp. TaxID=1960880 RepID=UPI002DDD2ED3|nr:L,D-transpeptidase family protein [Pseudolabrys sp.]HEV2628553.1 L,D-transpeptidase family protein [Pseudolabrys sp.]